MPHNAPVTLSRSQEQRKILGIDDLKLMSAFTMPWKVSCSDPDAVYPLTSESLSYVSLANLRAEQRPEWQKWLVEKEVQWDRLQERWVMGELHSRNSSAGPAAAFQKINLLDSTS